MTEYERMAAGLLYNDGEPQMLAERKRAAELCHDYNYHTRPTDGEAKRAILEQLLGSMGKHCSITPPFWCDFGYNIHVGEGFYANHGLNMLDGAPITIGQTAISAPRVTPMTWRSAQAALWYRCPSPSVTTCGWVQT